MEIWIPLLVAEAHGRIHEVWPQLSDGLAQIQKQTVTDKSTDTKPPKDSSGKNPQLWDKYLRFVRSTM